LPRRMIENRRLLRRSLGAHSARKSWRGGKSCPAQPVVQWTLPCLDAVASRVGAAVGSMHPLQSFSGVSVPSMEGKVFTIEGRKRPAVRVARRNRLCTRWIAPCAIAGSKETFVSRGPRRMAAGHVLAVEGSRHAVAPLAGDEAKRRPCARLVCL